MKKRIDQKFKNSTMNVSDLFKQFALENLNKLPHPSQNKEIQFDSMNELIDLLYRFLNYETDEPGLQRLSDNFELNFNKVYDINLKELPTAIENLATSFESLLRKIAYLKYRNTAYWSGDETYIGINKSTLADLISSELAPKKEFSETLPRKKYPEMLLDYTGTRRAILDFVRDNLRNAIHYTRNYNRTELIKYSNYSLGIYLMAVNDNKSFLRRKLFPEYNYLEKILINEDLIKLNKYYVELFGIESLTFIDNVAVEVMDGEKLLASLESIFVEESEDEKEEQKIGSSNARVDSVLNIAKDTNRFIIIGEPGSGKTTTLLKLQFENANELIKGGTRSKLPVYINASSYGMGRSFRDLISAKIDFGDLETMISKFELLILIDGLNEISDEFKRKAYDELRNLMTIFYSVSFILTSRKFSFHNYWDLPVYELKDLNEQQIIQLSKNILGELKGKSLWSQISINKRIFELCHNPLLLMMVIKVSSLKDGNIPSNKGMLYRLFNSAILAREKKIYFTDASTKVNLLSHLAFYMRSQGMFRRIKIELAKEKISEKLFMLTKSIGINEIFNELVDNNFLSIRDDDIEFLHETYQEYYVALEIYDQFFKFSDLQFDYDSDKWLEPLLICSDLFTEHKDRERYLKLLFIGKRNSIQKSIDELNSCDINDKFPVACKVAYNIKQEHPRLYSYAESLLNNYLIIWSYQKSRGIEIIAYEKLVQGISSISSEYLFAKIFMPVKYLFYWFYNKHYDDNPEEYLEEIQFENKFSSLSKTFADNLSDFELAYKMLTDLISSNNCYWFSPSIRYNIIRFKKYLIHNTSIVKLIQAFKNLRSIELLKKIGISELDFFVENFPLVSQNMDQFYDFIITNHKRNINGQQFLMKTLSNESIDFSIRMRICESLLGQPDCFFDILNYVKDLLTRSDLVINFDVLRGILNSISFEILQENSLAQLFTYPDVREIEFNTKAFAEDFNCKKMIFKVPSTIIPVSQFRRLVSNVFFQGKNIVPELLFDHPASSEELKIIIVEGLVSDIDILLTRDDQNGSMSMVIGDFRKDSTILKLKFISIFKGTTRARLHIVVDEHTYSVISNVNRTGQTVNVILDSTYSFKILNLNIYKIEYSVIAIDKLLLGSVGINDSINLKMLDITIDFNKPSSYHRDIFIEKDYLIRYLSGIKSDILTGVFIKRVGLIGTVFPLDLNSKYCLVLQVKNVVFYFEFLLYSFIDNKTFTIINYTKSTNVIINDIVILEKNACITKVRDEEIPNSLFEISEIISIDQNKKEGFIKSRGQGKDYYFSYSYLDFNPSLKMKVRFLPGKNLNKKYNDLPMAYCIREVAESLPKAFLKSIKNFDNYYNLYLEDIVTAERLFCRMQKTELTSISNFNQSLRCNQVFHYKVLHSSNIGSNQLARILLIEFEVLSS